MPEEVFKYCDSHGVDILRNLELKITPPDQFNDPFEFTPRVTCSSPRQHIKRLLNNKAEMRDMFLEQKREGSFTGSYRDFKRRLHTSRGIFLSNLIEKMPKMNAEFQAGFSDSVSRDMGVLCLSSRPYSIVMWGHYADKHRGIVIGFDRSWEVFHEKRGFKPVDYVDERPIWDTFRSRRELDSIDRVIFTKNKEWEYEAELRQLFLLEGLTKRPLKDRTIGYFKPVPPEVIRSVRLGVRCPPERASEISSILRAPQFAHVETSKSSLHATKYFLEYRE